MAKQLADDLTQPVEAAYLELMSATENQPEQIKLVSELLLGLLAATLAKAGPYAIAQARRCGDALVAVFAA
jgi:hypothetical protein